MVEGVNRREKTSAGRQRSHQPFEIVQQQCIFISPAVEARTCGYTCQQRSWNASTLLSRVHTVAQYEVIMLTPPD